MIPTRCAALAAFLLLTACGGGGGDGPRSPAEVARDFSRNGARAAQIAAATAAMSQTPVAAMPTGGRAEYDGVVGMAFGAAPGSIAVATMVGDLDLDADFATNRITGELDDFDTRDGRELNGALRVSNGRISGSTFSGDISGNLGGRGRVPGAVNGTISGEFRGADAGAIEGTGTAVSGAGDLGLVFRGLRDRD